MIRGLSAGCKGTSCIPFLPVTGTSATSGRDGAPWRCTQLVGAAFSQPAADYFDACGTSLMLPPPAPSMHRWLAWCVQAAPPSRPRPPAPARPLGPIGTSNGVAVAQCNVRRFQALELFKPWPRRKLQRSHPTREPGIRSKGTVGANVMRVRELRSAATERGASAGHFGPAQSRSSRMLASNEPMPEQIPQPCGAWCRGRDSNPHGPEPTAS